MNLEKWSDGDNWNSGHWLNGRVGSCPLDALIEEICTDFGYTNIKIECDGLVEGYVINGNNSLKDALDPILKSFNISLVESEGVFHFKGKEYLTKQQIDIADLVQENEDTKLIIARQSETELPREIALNHSDLFADYTPAISVSRRLETLSDLQLSLDLPAIIEKSEATKIVDARLRDIWNARKTAGFALPYKYLSLSAGDLLEVTGLDQTYQVHSIEDGVQRNVEAIGFSHFEASKPGQLSDKRAIETAHVTGPPLVALMNLPLGQDSLSPMPALYLATQATPWQPIYTASVSSSDSNFKQRATVSQPSNIMLLEAPLTKGPLGRWDSANPILVRGSASHLISYEAIDVFSGSGALAVETTSGNWEILQYANAELIEPGLWRLSKLLRGQMGTGHEMAAGSSAGAKVVDLNGPLKKIELSSQEVGLALNWRVVSAFEAHNPQKATLRSETCNHLSARPLSPVHLKVKKYAAKYQISWIRRSRVNADNWDVATTPLGETSERYELLVKDVTGVVKYTSEVSEPSFDLTDNALSQIGLNMNAKFSVYICALSESGMKSPAASLSIN